MGRSIDDYGNREGGGGRDLIRVLLAIFLPPVAVFLEVGLGAQFWINLLLTPCSVICQA